MQKKKNFKNLQNGQENMAGKNSRTCKSGAKLQKYCNFLKFYFKIPWKGCLDKFLT